MPGQPFISTGRTNAAVLDAWSIVHFGTGLIFGAVGMNAWLYTIGHMAYEVAEYAHESPRGSILFGSKQPEWDVNMVSDMSVGFFGYALGRWLRGDVAPPPPADARRAA